MGCGGSKDEVATGNTVSTKSLQRGKSFEKGENTNGQIKDIKIESAEKIPLPESTVGDTDSKEAAAVGKLISKDSPDLYFSSRKDDTTIAVVAVVAADPPEAKNAAADPPEVAPPPPPNAVSSPIDNEKPEAEDIQDSKEQAAASIEVNGSDSTAAEKKNQE